MNLASLCPQCTYEITEDEVLCVGCDVSYHKACGKKCILCGGSAVDKNALVIKGNTLPADSLDAVLDAYKNNSLSPLETATKVLGDVLGDNATYGLMKVHSNYAKESGVIEQRAHNVIEKYDGPRALLSTLGMGTCLIGGFIGGLFGGLLSVAAIEIYLGYSVHSTHALLTFLSVGGFCTLGGFIGAPYSAKFGEWMGEYVSRFLWPNQDTEKKMIQAKKEEELNELKEKYQRLLTEK